MTKSELLKKLADLQYTIEALQKIQGAIENPDFKSLKLSGDLKVDAYSNLTGSFGLKLDQKETKEIVGILLSQKKYAYDRLIEKLLEWDVAETAGECF